MQECARTWRTARLPSTGLESTDHHGMWCFGACTCTCMCVCCVCACMHMCVLILGCVDRGSLFCCRQPEFGGWGFNLPRGEPCRKVWEKIPEGIDILITHGPPIGHGDLCLSHQRAGCVDLLREIQERVKPKYHVFGHIHEGRLILVCRQELLC